MATMLLSAAGAAIGGSFGGTFLGLSGAMIGRAVGASIGRAIDQRLLGAGSEPVEMGRVDRFRLTGASEGAPLPLIYGRMRVAGQVIWATRFEERVRTSSQRGGKGGGPQVTTRAFSYSVSLAIALCEGEILRIGRVWADGEEIACDDLPLRVYAGTEDQLPDPKIVAVEGAENAPAYRGIAYVVLEGLELGRFGNRVPQFNFEVFRPALVGETASDLPATLRGVALMPGTGEYALATTPVHYQHGLGVNVPVNVNSPGGKTDLEVALTALREELPRCESVLVIVSWFGDDLRCAQCRVEPMVEQKAADGKPQPWKVCGVTRTQAREVGRIDDRPVYGGTPGDASVIESLKAIRSGGQAAVFYPFMLMGQMAGNNRPDPYSDAPEQPVFPWRGRITCSVAPGRDDTPDRTAAAEAEVAAFFGAVQPSHFGISGGQVIYSGPPEWSYRRFILHYAFLCKAAGGVDAFCVGSEMRGLTQIRGAGDSFPAVAQLRQLAVEVRAILGPETKISYAADWSEYFGFVDGQGNRYFHLDPFWADENIDFVGIDNYMPLSDWRDGETHADAGFGSIYNLDYLTGNVAGGEGFDWYYASDADAAAQTRTPITDGAYDEPWIWRYKDLKSWWLLPHHERLNGVRDINPTAWVPQSKPIWFTEYGCPSVDKGTNEPNKFVDPKSSESFLPRASSGARDDAIQMQYFRAMARHWGDVSKNPISALYGGPMVDMARAHAWAWDARPFPHFPGNLDIWSDGTNYALGHWLTGRTAAQPLADIVADLCARGGVHDVDVTDVHGIVRGYSLSSGETARAALQPLMLAHAFDAVEFGGQLVFRMREARPVAQFSLEELAVDGDIGGALETQRAPVAEIAGRVRINFVESEGDYEVRAAEAILADEVSFSAAQTEIPLGLTQAEGRAIAERWLAQARVARDGARFALPPSRAIRPGDVVRLIGPEGSSLYRADRVETTEAQLVEAVRVEPGVFTASDAIGPPVRTRAFVPPAPVFPLFLDLPLLSGEENPQAPHVAVTATPWPGSVAIWSSAQDSDYEVNRLIEAPATIGVTETDLQKAKPGVWDRGPALRVRVYGGALSSAAVAAVLNGANLMAIGDGTSGNWEVFQFAEAELVAPDTYDLRIRLRGQAGTDALMPWVWPAGSYVVRIGASVDQIDLPPQARGMVRHFRIGPAARGYEDPSYIYRVDAFEGAGLRPLSPCHLRVTETPEGLAVRWVRRSRIDSDRWDGLEVPVGEESESYLLRVVKDATVRREVLLAEPRWSYPTIDQAADGVIAPFRVEVAQVSARVGPGPFTGVKING